MSFCSTEYVIPLFRIALRHDSEPRAHDSEPRAHEKYFAIPLFAFRKSLASRQEMLFCKVYCYPFWHKQCFYVVVVVQKFCDMQNWCLRFRLPPTLFSFYEILECGGATNILNTVFENRYSGRNSE